VIRRRRGALAGVPEIEFLGGDQQPFEADFIVSR